MMGDAGTAQTSVAEHMPQVLVEECAYQGAREDSLQVSSSSSSSISSSVSTISGIPCAHGS
jgi:hypothetical protein